MLADALKEYKTLKSTQVRRCIVGDWSAKLPAEDQEVLEEVLNDVSISNRALLTILRTADANYSLEALRKHRTQECPCQA